MHGYAVPYFWGTLGIGYRADLVPEEITSWQQLFEPAEFMRGKTVMLNTARDLVSMALKALGHSANTNDPEHLLQAERLLGEQSPYVHSYSYVSLSEESALVSGEVWATMMFSGDVLMVQQYEPNVMFVLPEEGGNIWVDYIAVMQSSTNKELAMQFVNFLNEPRIAARVAEFVYYATPNKSAEQYLPEDYFQNPIIYPNTKQLARSEYYRELSMPAQRQVNRIASRIIKNEPASP